MKRSRGRRQPRLIRCANCETGKLLRIDSSGNHAKIAIPLGALGASKCGKKFPGESESKKRRVLTRKQVCVKPGKISPDPARYKIREKASVPVKDNYGKCSLR